MRNYLIAGNWKMNMTLKESEALASGIKEKVERREGVDMVLCPPYTSLERVGKVLEGSFIQLGAQNMFWEEKGAYTGEISPLMLKDLGCKFVIIGHSERRKYFREDDQMVNLKIKSALKYGLVPIFCVGETLEEREKGVEREVVLRQLEGGLQGMGEEEVKKVVIAYEPVWAIGTGKTATPQEAERMHSFLRECLKKRWGDSVGDVVRILYGGSVKPDNIDDLMKEPQIDGVLVGGASLKVDSFVRIYNFQRR